MAIFRVSKNRNYTVMSNYHLKDRALTLKSKGLLSMMLSLPEEWDYTTRGLASICKEGVDAIGASLKELEAGGYLVRRQLRDSLTGAFRSPFPSFHPLDLCVGILIAVAIRLAVYLKAKNAKKYRKNVEYGSARWSA